MPPPPGRIDRLGRQHAGRPPLRPCCRPRPRARGLPSPIRLRRCHLGWCAVSIRVLLADDQAMVRAGFRMILESDPEIEVVGEAANGEQAMASTRRLRPAVVLMERP